jgi:hypothetical protein
MSKRIRRGTHMSSALAKSLRFCAPLSIACSMSSFPFLASSSAFRLHACEKTPLFRASSSMTARAPFVVVIGPEVLLMMPQLWSNQSDYNTLMYYERSQAVSFQRVVGAASTPATPGVAATARLKPAAIDVAIHACRLSAFCSSQSRYMGMSPQ